MILTDKREIRAALHSITSASSGRRIILAAYVGRDPHEYVADMAGIDVFCSNNPVGTDPKGIETLLRGDARVWFVKGLHAKLFWSEHGGCLIGSTNLSTNALGDGGLFETATLVKNVDIDDILRRMKRHASPVLVDENELEKLRQAHRRAKGRVKPQKPKERKSVESFESWILNPFRESFSVAFWQEPDESGLTANERRSLIEEFDTDQYFHSLRVSGRVRRFPANENVLVLKEDGDGVIKASGAYWMREDRRFLTAAGRGGAGVRTKIIQIHEHDDPDPFKPFGKALAAAMNAFFANYDQEVEDGASFAVGSRNMKKLVKIGEQVIGSSTRAMQSNRVSRWEAPLNATEA